MLGWIYGAVAVVNAVTFCMFGYDKVRARGGRRRVPEATLLWACFATGVVGGWVAMTTFRHKTRKTSFRIKMILVTLVNPLWLLLYATLR